MSGDYQSPRETLDRPRLRQTAHYNSSHQHNDNSNDPLISNSPIKSPSNPSSVRNQTSPRFSLHSSTLSPYAMPKRKRMTSISSNSSEIHKSSSFSNRLHVILNALYQQISTYQKSNNFSQKSSLSQSSQDANIEIGTPININKIEHYNANNNVSQNYDINIAVDGRMRDSWVEQLNSQQSNIDKIEEMQADYPRLTLNNGQTITCSLLIGADGANSTVKSTFSNKMNSIGFDYHQRAVVATVQHDTSPHYNNNIAYQRFLPDGPVALLPCTHGYSNIVWSTSPTHAQHLCSISNEQFISDLNNAFRAEPSSFQPSSQSSTFESLLPSQLSQLLPTLFPRQNESNFYPPEANSVNGPRLFFPLRWSHCQNYVLDRVALVGDAAHVVHPLAGQGVNLGWADVQSLSQVIASSVENGQDIGLKSILSHYESARFNANLSAMTAIHTIGQLFRAQLPPIAYARGVGMDLFNAIPQIKNAASKQAMGL